MSELIDKFKNGRSLYAENALFHKLIHNIASGMTLYQAIEVCIDVIEHQNDVIKTLLEILPAPQIKSE